MFDTHKEPMSFYRVLCSVSVPMSVMCLRDVVSMRLCAHASGCGSSACVIFCLCLCPRRRVCERVYMCVCTWVRARVCVCVHAHICEQ